MCRATQTTVVETNHLSAKDRLYSTDQIFRRCSAWANGKFHGLNEQKLAICAIQDVEFLREWRDVRRHNGCAAFARSDLSLEVIRHDEIRILTRYRVLVYGC